MPSIGITYDLGVYKNNKNINSKVRKL